MREFIDVEGASGVTYRFRLWPEGQLHRPIAGNYLCIRAEGEEIAIVGIGETLDLSGAAEEVPKRVRQATTHLYTRLNIARAARCAEHEDLAARHWPKLRASAA